jgi:23S rRNA A1618 N6-methylase RlmF
LRRERIPQFLFQIADYLLKEKRFTGTMEELLVAIGNKSTVANVASKLVTRHFNDVFKPLGIKMDRKRVAAARLMFWQLNDDDDGNDDQRRSEALASLRQQYDDPSSFSQTSSQSSFASWEVLTDPDDELPFK